ncbi:MAG: hypothetical protein GOU98_03530 [Candidatus Altiarchaeota archaeon]|nr:hypothetical protein [Candidatus Altiarchaeota archaeon]
MGMGQDGLLRGLSSFEARAIALILLLLIVFPNVSLASSENPDISIEIFGTNNSVRGETLNLTVAVSGSSRPINLTWILPLGFENLEPVKSYCENLPCNQTLKVRINESSGVGNQIVGVEVEYV